MTSEKTRFIPVKPDSWGYADLYKCERCGNRIYAGYHLLWLDYNFCPWCGAENEGGEENEV